MLGKSLVIVESPAKAKTIINIWVKIMWCVQAWGHVRDLPVGGSATKTNKPKMLACLVKKKKPKKH